MFFLLKKEQIIKAKVMDYKISRNNKMKDEELGKILSDVVSVFFFLLGLFLFVQYDNMLFLLVIFTLVFIKMGIYLRSSKSLQESLILKRCPDNSEHSLKIHPE